MTFPGTQHMCDNAHTVVLTAHVLYAPCPTFSRTFHEFSEKTCTETRVLFTFINLFCSGKNTRETSGSARVIRVGFNCFTHVFHNFTRIIIMFIHLCVHAEWVLKSVYRWLYNIFVAKFCRNDLFTVLKFSSSSKHANWSKTSLIRAFKHRISRSGTMISLKQF